MDRRTPTITTINENLERALSKGIGENYNPVIGAWVTDAVHNSLEGSLGVRAEEIVPQATLIKDLRAESIDGLDIWYRLEKDLDIKFPRPNNMLITEQDEYQTVLGLTKIIYAIKTS